MPLPLSTSMRGAQNTGALDAPIGPLAAGTELSTMVIRLFADFQKYLEPDETPFSSSVKHGKAVNQKKVEFGIGFLSPHTVTLGASVGTSTTGSVTTVSLAAGDAAKLQVTDVLRITSVLPAPVVEHWWVTGFAGAANTVDVKRGMGTAVGAATPAHTLGTPTPQVIEILGPASQENADSQLAPIVKGAIEFNVPQLYDYAVQVSNRADNTPDYEFDGASRYDAYLQRIMTSASIDFEKSSIMGKRQVEDSMVVGTGLPTMMGGLDFFTDQAYDLLGAPLTESFFRLVQRDLWTKVGSNAADSAIMGGFMREAVSSIWNANRYATVKDQSTTLVWKSVETEYGTLRFNISRYIPAGSLFFINLEDISIRPYKGGEWADVQLQTQGPYKKGRFTGDYTMTFLSNAARAKIVNASVLAADYPNLA